MKFTYSLHQRYCYIDYKNKIQSVCGGLKIQTQKLLSSVKNFLKNILSVFAQPLIISSHNYITKLFMNIKNIEISVIVVGRNLIR